MSLYKIISQSLQTKLYFWKITEDIKLLFQSVSLKDSSLARLNGMKSESHQKGFLAVRMLLQEAGYTDFDLYYDEFGKPHLKDGSHISISHSNDFSMIVISNVNIGADIEIVKDKALKIAPKYMDISHLLNLSKEEELKKATVVWGIKESVFKLKNEAGISFKDHIFEDKFKIVDKKCGAELRFDNKTENFDIIFDFIENYAFVCAFESV